MLQRLPGWVQDNVAAVRDEASRYREMSHEQRWKALAAACRGAARQLASRPDAARLLAYRDPLPGSTLTALSRLRQRARSR